MKQRMEIVVVTEIDCEGGFNQLSYEKALAESIKTSCKEILKCPKNNTEVFIEYGDPV